MGRSTILIAVARVPGARRIRGPYSRIQSAPGACAATLRSDFRIAGLLRFYVAADGQFHFCAHVPPAANFSDVTAADLARWGGAKGCEKNCGVDCCTHTSLPYSALGSVARQPEQTGTIRGLMILLAALVEGAGIVGILFSLASMFL